MRAFNKVLYVADELKLVVAKAGINIEKELAVIGISIDQSFQDPFLKLDNRLFMFCRIHNLKVQLEASRPTPIKLERAEVIKFSGELQDFATFKW